MKKLFFLVFFLISTTLFAQDFTLVDWNNWQVDYEDPKQLRLAYLKIISDFPKFPAKEFLTYEEFLEKKSQLKFDRQLPQTFGQLKAHILEEQAPVATETFSLSQEEVPQALVEDLKQWKDSLNSRTFPTEKIRLEVAIAYCKVLGEKTVKEFLSGSERYDLRNELLEPIATLLKTDPAWGFRRDILAPIMRYQIFSGTTFTLELLEMVTSDPNHMVQLELLRLLQESNIFSYTLLRPTLIQLIEEDENSQVKAAAQAFLKELEIKYQVAT
ncbi:MAG: hypothetical protein HYW85_04505, partial [Deltaproteobacteria bacterium]|nr:hypothetical protein [Deltaproteobacteria bacterium]